MQKIRENSKQRWSPSIALALCVSMVAGLVVTANIVPPLDEALASVRMFGISGCEGYLELNRALGDLGSMRQLMAGPCAVLLSGAGQLP